MIGHGVSSWLGLLVGLLVVLGIVAVFTIVFAAAGTWALESYVQARRQRHPSRRLWFAVMWMCYALSGVVVAAGLYLFVTG